MNRFVAIAAAILMLSGCAAMRMTPEQQARQKQLVEEKIQNHQFTISIDRMLPMRGAARNIQGYSLQVDGNRLISYLPYFGVAYDAPYGGGKGLNFEADILEYSDTIDKDSHVIQILVDNEEDVYFYSITIFDNGSSSVYVKGRKREQISYTGRLETPELYTK